MNFVAVVDQAIALLRQRGRLTYRTFQGDNAPPQHFAHKGMSLLRHCHRTMVRLQHKGDTA